MGATRKSKSRSKTRAAAGPADHGVDHAVDQGTGPRPWPEGPAVKRINLALQGGGAHGAFTWGVLDRLLEDDGIVIEGISGTSAGAVNGAVMAYGLTVGGRATARELLASLWDRIAALAAIGPLQPSPVDRLLSVGRMDTSPGYVMLDMLTRVFSPYHYNVLNLNPLRHVLEEIVDFEVLRGCRSIKLFVGATNVLRGRIKIFQLHEMTLDVTLASACLPFMQQAVEIDGEAYWDGGYMGNPAIYPLIYECASPDVAIVQINPLERAEVPKTAVEILDRVNEISFNSTLMREMRAIAFVTKLIDQGGLKVKGYKRINVHLIEDLEDMKVDSHGGVLAQVGVG